MNTRNNKRRRESVQRIEQALLEELKTKELAQIKVSDICKAADINRSTFYANYTDIYDLADKIREGLEVEVYRLFEQEVEVRHNGSDFLKLFCHISENQLLYQTFFKLDYDSEYGAGIYEFFRLMDDFDTKYLAYHIEFFRNGFNAIVRKWLEGDCKETPEEMYNILMNEYRGRFKKE